MHTYIYHFRFYQTIKYRPIILYIYAFSGIIELYTYVVCEIWGSRGGEVPIVVFWIVTSCGLAGGYQRFGGMLVTTVKMEKIHSPETLVTTYKTHSVITQGGGD
jgi:hypothetical protein